jgi:hypothetical protein
LLRNDEKIVFVLILALFAIPALWSQVEPAEVKAMPINWIFMNH